MAKLELRNLCRHFGSVWAVKDLSLTVNDGEFVTLLGPSGCGKSTTLNLIAGLEKPTSGDVLLDGEVITDLPPNERGMAMVFQNYALYPHMTVFDNIAFSLRLRGTPKAAIEEKVSYISKLLDIGQLLKRKPAQLSGGQQQRVAVARALAKEPQVSLFDEPLSNLDAALRARTRTEIKRLHLDLRATTIFVTHDQEEAMAMSDRIAVMRAGTVVQYASPDEIYRCPATLYVATFIGKPTMNVVRGTLHVDNGGMTLQNGAGRLQWASPRDARLDTIWDSEAAIGIGVRAEAVRLYSAGTTAPAYGTFAAQVSLVEPLGSDNFVEVYNDAWRVIARVDPDRRFQRGEALQVEFPAAKLHIFDLGTGQRLNG